MRSIRSKAVFASSSLPNEALTMPIQKEILSLSKEIVESRSACRACSNSPDASLYCPRSQKDISRQIKDHAFLGANCAIASSRSSLSIWLRTEKSVCLLALLVLDGTIRTFCVHLPIQGKRCVPCVPPSAERCLSSSAFL